MGFDSIVLKNSMSQFGVKRPRGGQFGTWFHVDSLEVMKDAMPSWKKKKLHICMDYFFDECQPSPHNALTDATCVKRLCEHYARTRGYNCFDDLLNDHDIGNRYLYNF